MKQISCRFVATGKKSKVSGGNSKILRNEGYGCGIATGEFIEYSSSRPKTFPDFSK